MTAYSAQHNGEDPCSCNLSCVGKANNAAWKVQAVEHWRALYLHKGLLGLGQAAHLKRIGQQVLGNFISRRVRAAWNAWVDLIQVF